jgi:ribosomal protein S18 acetylase RimI-like enzyme
MTKIKPINTTDTSFVIRKATADDENQIWAILKPIIRGGETYAIDRSSSRKTVLKKWTDNYSKCHVLERNSKVQGLYYIRANYEGGGNHICNCGFAVLEEKNGCGFGRMLLLDSLKKARELGFTGMQFNLVVSNNKRAIKLWESEGFDIIGRIPSAFNHPKNGFIDALIMFKTLIATK